MIKIIIKYLKFKLGLLTFDCWSCLHNDATKCNMLGNKDVDLVYGTLLCIAAFAEDTEI